jgi:hypothetical protein
MGASVAVGPGFSVAPLVQPAYWPFSAEGDHAPRQLHFWRHLIGDNRIPSGTTPGNWTTIGFD